MSERWTSRGSHRLLAGATQGAGATPGATRPAGEWWWLTMCVAVGAAVRVYLALTATVIARDGVVYVTMARRMVTDWRGELAADYPLGFPFLIRWVHGLVGPWLSRDVVIGWQRSGQVVSLLFGVGSIVLVYMLARRLIGGRGAMFAAWIWALLPQAAGLSADALTDMPTVALMLGGVLAVMRGGIGWFFVAGLLSGAASTMRPEGAEMVLVGLMVLGLKGRNVGTLKRRNVETSKRRNVEMRKRHGGTEARRHGWEDEAAMRRWGMWRAWAGVSLVAGFAVIGGTYLVLEGGRVLHKQTWMGEQAGVIDVSRYLLASAEGGVVRAAGLIVEKLFGSLNGVWMIWGTAYVVVMRGRVFRQCDAMAAELWWGLHAVILVWFASRSGYLSGRHCLVLDVCFVVMSGGMLAWVGVAAAARAPRSVSVTAKRGGVVVLVVSCAALTPWLLRDIHEGRGSVREAAAWIARENGGRGNPGMVAMDGWVPFYSGATRWADCAKAEELGTCAELGDSAWLVMMATERPAGRVLIAATGKTVELTEAARFGEATGRRGVVVYQVRRVRQR